MKTFQFTVMSGVEDGNTYTVDTASMDDKVIRIGRGSDNTLVITSDPAVSRLHAVIYADEGWWWLEDKASKNGTFTDNQDTLQPDERVRERVRLDDGQLFRVGKTWLRIDVIKWNTHG